MKFSALFRARCGLGSAIAAMALALIAGCGGGGSAGVDTGTTAAAYTAGPVSGFGSIIVNGVRFDDRSASVEDEDGQRGGSVDLKLGVMVEIDSDVIDELTHRAHALRIRFGSEIVGPVESVDPAAGSFVALGQTVEVRPATVFDDSLTGGIAGLAGHTVGVHALFNAATGHYIATRIEDRNAPEFYKLRGVVSSFTLERRISRTIDMGFRREPQPPMPIVIPSRSSETASHSVVRLSISAPLMRVQDRCARKAIRSESLGNSTGWQKEPRGRPTPAARSPPALSSKPPIITRT